MKKIITLVLLIFSLSCSFGQYGFVKSGDTWIPYPQKIGSGEGWTDWSNAGREGGTPTSYQLGVPVTLYENALTDINFQNLSTALTAAATLSNGNQLVVVNIPAGHFTITKSISISSNVVLKGAGSDQTFLTFQTGNKVNDCVSFRGFHGSDFKVISGQTMGSNSIILDDASSFKNLDYIDLRDSRSTQGNDNEESYSIGQIVQIIGKSGNTLTLKDKLSIDHSGFETRVCYIDAVSNAGMEDLSLTRAMEGSGGGYNARIEYAVNCWIRGCELSNASSRGINIAYSSQITIKGNCIHDDQANDGANGNGYGISLYYRSTNCLIEDNILYNLRHSILMSVSVNRNVIAYNYAHDRSWYEGTVFISNCGDIQLHGEYSHRNLFEGNTVDNIIADDWYGGLKGYSSSKLTGNGPYNVFLRNEVKNTYNAMYDIYLQMPILPGIQLLACDNAFVIGNKAVANTKSSLGNDGWTSLSFRSSNNVTDVYGIQSNNCITSTVSYLYFKDYFTYFINDVSYYMTQEKMRKLWTDSQYPEGINPINGPLGGYITYGQNSCNISKLEPLYTPAFLRGGWTKKTLSGGKMDVRNITISYAYPEGNGSVPYQIKLDGTLTTSNALPLITGTMHNIEIVKPSGWTGWWEDGEKNNSRTIAVTSDMNYVYVLKKIHYSISNTAFSNSSQRKFVKNESNQIACVYESNGKIWGEYSFDQGTTWSCFNDGFPLNDGIAKCPSITSCNESREKILF